MLNDKRFTPQTNHDRHFSTSKDEYKKANITAPVKNFPLIPEPLSPNLRPLSPTNTTKAKYKNKGITKDIEVVDFIVQNDDDKVLQIKAIELDENIVTFDAPLSPNKDKLSFDRIPSVLLTNNLRNKISPDIPSTIKSPITPLSKINLSPAKYNNIPSPVKVQNHNPFQLRHTVANPET